MSIYSATEARDLDQCLAHLVRQTLPADQIVLVWDGAINSDVENCINRYTLALPFQHLRLQQHRGLGPALRDGLNLCRNELIARVDSDDWSVSTRFEQQIKFLQNEPQVSVLGGWLKEWYHRKGVSESATRTSPLEHDSIKRVAKLRNPINHPTVMFRKSHVLSCGSYEKCDFFEDYFLWAKLITHGYILRNLPQVLVETTVDTEYFRRRGGFTYIKNELNLTRKLAQIGFFGSFWAVLFFFCRSPFRFAPIALRTQLYRTLLRK